MHYRLLLVLFTCLNSSVCLSIHCNYEYVSVMCNFIRAGNSLICSSLICSFAHFAQIKWATVSDSLRALKTNERLWANRSGFSWQMSKLSSAHDKLATVSDSLRSLMINVQMSNLLKKFWLKKPKIFFNVCFMIVFLF